MYTKKQLIDLRNYIESIDKKEDEIEKWFAIMFEDQYCPRISYYSLIYMIWLLDETLSDILDYVFYECKGMKDWWSISYPDWREYKIQWNLEWFLIYCEAEWIIREETDDEVCNTPPSV